MNSAARQPPSATIDDIVVTPEDVEGYKGSLALVIEPALREGKVVYAG